MERRAPYPPRSGDFERMREAQEKSKTIVRRDGSKTINDWLERKQQQFIARGKPPA